MDALLLPDIIESVGNERTIMNLRGNKATLI